MTSFDVHPSGGGPRRTEAARSGGGPYAVHPLPAMGGVFAYVERNGEGVGLYFGETELAVATAVADAMVSDTEAE
jgi:hypothetical protein